jgi:hypothetical protein
MRFPESCANDDWQRIDVGFSRYSRPAPLRIFFAAGPALVNALAGFCSLRIEDQCRIVPRSKKNLGENEV